MSSAVMSTPRILTTGWPNAFLVTAGVSDGSARSLGRLRGASIGCRSPLCLSERGATVIDVTGSVADTGAWDDVRARLPQPRPRDRDLPRPPK